MIWDIMHLIQLFMLELAIYMNPIILHSNIELWKQLFYSVRHS